MGRARHVDHPPSVCTFAVPFFLDYCIAYTLPNTQHIFKAPLLEALPFQKELAQFHILIIQQDLSDRLSPFVRPAWDPHGHHKGRVFATCMMGGTYRCYQEIVGCTNVWEISI